MKKKTTFGLLGLAAAGVGAAGGWTALGNYLYNQCMVPKVRDPDLPEANPLQEEGRLWARPVRTKSGLISSLAGSDGYLMISKDCEGLSQGAQVDVFFYSED